MHTVTRSTGVEELLRFSGTPSTPRPARLDPDRWVRIDRGVYLDASHVPFDLKPWEASRVVAKARVLAISHRFRTGRSAESQTATVAFTAASALVATDLGTWEQNPPVTIRVTRSQHRLSPLPTVVLRGHPIEGVPLRQTTTVINGAESVPTPDWTSSSRAAVQTGDRPISLTVPSAQGACPTAATVSGAPWHTVIRDLAALDYPLAAFVNACTILRHYTAFDRFWLEESLEREATFKRELGRDLGDFGRGRSARTLRRILVHATGATESPGEAAMLWHLRSVLDRAVHLELQWHVYVRGRTFYLDAAIPSQKIGFEFDGVSKFSSDQAEWSRQTQDFLQRQNLLAGAGWTVIRLTWGDVADPTRAEALLRRQLEPFGVCG